MAEVKISLLPSTASGGAADMIPIVQGGVTKRIAPTALPVNSHSHTKGDVGLGNVDNTSDADKPVSAATAIAIAALTKASVGLGNVDNTSDANKPVSTAVAAALGGKVDDAQVLTNVPAGAVFTDTDTDTVYDDSAVLKDADTVSPVTGVNKLITQADVTGGGDMSKSTYDTNSNGTVDNAEKVNGLTVETAVPVGAVFTDTDTTYSVGDGGLTEKNLTAALAANIAVNNAKVSNVSHPTVEAAVPAGAVFTDTVYDDSSISAATAAAIAAIDKTSVGLGNVDNTTDLLKPVSTATSAAIAAVTKSSIGLGSVDNTTDALKPVSTATAAAIAALDKTSVGLGNVDNTSDANKPVSSATSSAIAAVTLSTLTPTTVTTVADADSVATTVAGAGKKITKGNFTKDQRVVKILENANASGNKSGTYSQDIDTNGNGDVITITGNITLNQPTVTLTGSQSVWGAIEIIGGDGFAMTFPGTDWDWGENAEPTPTAKFILGFTKRAGDTKTKVWHIGGFA